MENRETHMDRRQFFKRLGAGAAGAAMAALPMAALGQIFGSRKNDVDEKQYDFLIARVKYNDDQRVPDQWNVYPGAERNLLTELSSVVRCKVKIPTNCCNESPRYGYEHFNGVVSFDEPETLQKFPFALMTGEGAFSLTANAKESMRQYLKAGGFLLMDDCVYSNGQGGDFFYQASYRTLEELFGKGSVVRIPKTHEVFHNVFDFGDQGMPYWQGQNYGAHGLFIDGRLAAFLSSSDIHCAWTTPYWFGHEKYSQALQMGINIAMYAMSH